MVEAVRQGIGAGLLLCPLAEPLPELTRLAEPSPAMKHADLDPDPSRPAPGRADRAFTQFLFDALSSDPRLATEPPAIAGSPTRIPGLPTDGPAHNNAPMTRNALFTDGFG